MTASISHEQNVANSIDIESLAILRGLQHCHDHEISNLLIESDCQTMVNIRALMSRFPLDNIQFGLSKEIKLLKNQLEMRGTSTILYCGIEKCLNL